MHQAFKEYFIPLLAPLVAIIVPTILFYVIPRRWQRYNLALAFFDKFNTEEMRQARLDAWAYFVTELTADDNARRLQRLREFIEYLHEPEIGRRIDRATHDVYQKASRVLDFFAIVDGSLGRQVVEPRMLRSFLAYYYRWWREMIFEPIWHQRGQGTTADTQHLPIWYGGLDPLDRLCGIKARADRSPPVGDPRPPSG